MEGVLPSKGDFPENFKNLSNMNLNLKAVYFCSTSQQKWGKGLTIEEAKKNAKMTKADKKVQYVVWAACQMHPTDEQLKGLLECITADLIDGHPIYYQTDRTQEDSQLIAECHVGWLKVETNIPEEKPVMVDELEE